MLAYGLIQNSATFVSAVLLATIHCLRSVCREAGEPLFNGFVKALVAEGSFQAEAVRYCIGG